MTGVHITTARKILDAGDAVDLVVWVSRDKNHKAETVRYDNVISMKFDIRKGTRTLMFRDSRQFRTLRDVCIYSINGQEVYL